MYILNTALYLILTHLQERFQEVFHHNDEKKLMSNST